jgi:hypothetical protein
MRILKRIPTVKQQDDKAWREQPNWTREVLHELGRLGYDLDAAVPIDAEDDATAAVRLHMSNVGARALTVVVRVSTGGEVQRVAIGQDSFTARQAALWLHKRAPRDDARRYLR